MNYNGNYFAEYLKRDDSEIGRRLTEARGGLVMRHARDVGPMQIVDVGIGGGAFVKYMTCFGYDVNESAVKWLTERESYYDIYTKPRATVLCFWDSLEHIPDPIEAIQQAGKWVFVSMPIYHNGEDAILSKHYKPGEHLWYWTRKGLEMFFKRHGFSLAECNTMETIIGREGIESFAFKRI